MLSPEERESIVDEIVERFLLRLPDAIGNLISNQAFVVRTNREFYSKHPDLAKNKDIVAEAIEQTENQNPGESYSKILELSIPKIRAMLKDKAKYDTSSITRPNRDLSSITSDNGDL